MSHVAMSGKSLPGMRDCEYKSPGEFREQQGGQCSWNRVSQREGGRRQSKRGQSEKRCS